MRAYLHGYYRIDAKVYAVERYEDGWKWKISSICPITRTCQVDMYQTNNQGFGLWKNGIRIRREDRFRLNHIIDREIARHEIIRRLLTPVMPSWIEYH